MAEFINLCVGERITDPDFDEMVGSAKEKTKTGQAMVCTIPIHQPHHRPRQNDHFNCGVFPALNVYAVFQSERQHYVRFDLISSTPEEWYTNIIPPFWNLPEDDRARGTLAVLKERAMSFRSNLLDIMVVKFHHNVAAKGLGNREITYMLDNGMGDYLPKKVKSGMAARKKAGLSELDTTKKLETGADDEPKGDESVKIDASATNKPASGADDEPKGDDPVKIDASATTKPEPGADDEPKGGDPVKIDASATTKPESGADDEAKGMIL